MRLNSFCTVLSRANISFLSQVNPTPSLALCARMLAWFFLAVPIASSASSKPAAPGSFEVPFRVVSAHAIVSVLIDGAGPFDFVLDNGCQTSIIDPVLAQSLGMPVVDHAILDSVSRSSPVSLVNAREVRLGVMAASNLQMMVDPLRGPRSVSTSIHGVLGEDFLQQFDFLLDNHNRKLVFEQNPGALLSGIDGTRVRLEKRVGPAGRQEYAQLLVQARSPQLGDKNLTMQLDSGTDTAILFTQVQSTLFLLGSSQPNVTLGENGPGQYARLVHVPSLWVSKVNLTDLPLVMLDNPPEKAPPIDGILPTAAFQSIYFNHSNGFIILNPRSATVISRLFP